MGNPSLQPPPVLEPGATAAAPPAANGILAKVPGDWISRGMQQLPPAGPELAAQAVRVVQLQVPDLGAVRITYELRSHKRARSRSWFWAATHAKLID